MKTINAAVVAALSAGAYPVRVVQSAPIGITIDPTQSFGVWEGWGTSLAWWANCYGQRDDLADAFFTLNDVQYDPNADPANKTRRRRSTAETIPGLGLTIARYNIGGSTNSTAGGQKMVQSPSMPWWKAIQGFWDNWNSADPNDSSSWTWEGRDVNQISMLKKAQSRGASKFQMFSNSPIWWMCTNHNPSGNDIGAFDNLQTWNHDQFAVYLTNTIQHFEEHLNVTFDSVEAFNEPNSDWWNAHGTQEGCHFSPSTQASVLASLQAGLRNRSLTTSIAASDENSYTLALSTWNSFSSSTKAVVDQIDVHGYEQARGPRSELYEASRGKVLWNSEYGEGDASGASLITNLNMDLTLLHPTAWVYWQAVDGSSWGLIEAKDEARGVTGVVQTKYYVLAHYSRHIRPGFKIISVVADQKDADYSTVAAFDNATSTVVIVSGNTGNSDVERSFDLSKFRSAGLAPLNVSNWQTQINGADRYARKDDIGMPSGAKSFTATVGAGSIRTFELQFSSATRAVP